MLTSAKNSELYAEWLAYIEQSDVKDAFCYIVGLAASLSSLSCHPYRHGAVRAFRFENPANEYVFAFIPNKKWLLFYFRVPAVRTGKYTLLPLRAAFKSAHENNTGEWTVKLRNIGEVQRLWSMLALT